MAESGVSLVSTKVEEDPRAAKMAAIRRGKRLHESLRNGFNPSATRLTSTARAAGMTYREIAEYLNNQGYVSPQGKQFYPMTVKRLFEDPI